jgi:hypothetical protein
VPVILATQGVRGRRIAPGEDVRPWADGVAQAVKYLPGKTLSEKITKAKRKTG